MRKIKEFVDIGFIKFTILERSFIQVNRRPTQMSKYTGLLQLLQELPS